ncbi:MAG: LytTR family DNA-binding domain-containing protein [Bacteroidetes bacterium]|jgi:two-component system LytT family response regulator|nr:LytTR family DNA-binding domain-containing protein [Bacteroidota bacterium]
MKWTAVIVDDERLARQELKRLLAEQPIPVQVLGEAAHAEEALQVLRESEPDILFLDVQMPGKSGFELLKELEPMPPYLIFTTAYDAHALRAFEVNALDYLLKPIAPDQLARALQRLGKTADEEAPDGLPEKQLREDDQVFLKDGDRCWFVKLKDIRLFESVGNYSKVFFEDQHPLILRSLNALEKRLDAHLFFRANRKQLVNLQHIHKVEPWFSGGLLLTLSDNSQIEVSRRQSGKMKERLSL